MSKPRHDIDLGGFRVRIYHNPKVLLDNYVHISTKSGVLDVKLRGATYFHLLKRADEGNTEELKAFCVMASVVLGSVYRDEELAQAIVRDIAEYTERLLKKAEDKAKEVSEADELAAEALMRDVAEYADAPNDKAREKIRKQWKKDVEEELARSIDEGED